MKIISKDTALFLGITFVVASFSVLGAIFLQEAESFVGPTQPPGAGYGPNIGVIGDPVTGIPGTGTLFTGQKKIYDEIVARCSGGGGGGGGNAGEISIAQPVYSISEDNVVLKLTVGVNRSNGLDGVVSVDYTTTDGTAKAGEDYQKTSGTITFTDGDAGPKFIDIILVNDALSEGDETFNFSISNPTNGATFGGITSALVTILDDEAVTCTDVLDKLGGVCTDIAEGFKLSNSSGLYFGGYSFDNNNLGAGNIQPMNVCVLARYGNQPASIPQLPKSTSYGVIQLNANNSKHWFGVCAPGTCFNCTSDHILTPGEDWNHFDKGNVCGGDDDEDEAWVEVDCYW